MIKIALFASGSGTNVQAIIDATERQEINAEIVCLFSDNPDAYVLKRAKKHQIPTFVLKPSDALNRKDWEEQILAFIQSHQTDLIVLAGFMRIIGQPLLTAYPNKIMNIHPSLLPSFPGRDGIGDAWDYGVKVTGVTIHWVDSGIDTGQIIAQESLAIQPGWTQEDLATEIHQIEHRLYPEVIQSVIEKLNQEEL